jgi:hypothetical protein
MTRFPPILIATLVLALAISACGEASPSSGSSAPDASTAVDPAMLRFTCGTFPFGPEVINDGPGTDEQAANPAATALRAHLAMDEPDIDFLPDTGWHLVGMDARQAEFVTVGGDLGMKMVSVENGPTGWKVSGWGDCQARTSLADGLGEAEWAFDPAQPKPVATTQVFDAMVTEMACNSGKAADGRIVGPQFVKSPASILVIFAVRPRPGGFQTCPSNPATRVQADLGEPLGNRKLLDGSRLPPGDPTEPLF